MITEQICIDVVLTLHKRDKTLTVQFRPDNSDNEIRNNSTHEHAESPDNVYLQLLPRYTIQEIDDAIRWLEYGSYISYAGAGFNTRMLMYLKEKGIQLANSGRLSNEDRSLVYQENPYAAFIARQFLDKDDILYSHLVSVLEETGIDAIDGRVKGIEAFRGDILRKIESSRFFVCLLTQREELLRGGFASSVWLYQETGAAVALGKKPLILVEDVMHEHYAGELQKNYEYILFSRTNYDDAFEEAGQRLKHDLIENNIPII